MDIPQKLSAQMNQQEITRARGYAVHWIHIGKTQNISWLRFDKRLIWGHLPLWKRICVGDELRAPMQSGKIARFRVKEVSWMTSPCDEFFGAVEDIAYLKPGEV